MNFLQSKSKIYSSSVEKSKKAAGKKPVIVKWRITEKLVNIKGRKTILVDLTARTAKQQKERSL